MPPRKGPYGAGCSEDAGRVIEPRNGYSRGQRGYPSSGHRGESRRCARAGRQQSCARYGKWAGHHRGLRAGHVYIGVTRELGRATCLLVENPDAGDRVTKSPGVVWALRPGHEPFGETTNEGSTQGIGVASDTRSPLRGGGGSRSGASYRGKWGSKAHGTHGREGDRRAERPLAGDRGETLRSPTLSTARQGTARGQQQLCVRNRMRALRTSGSGAP